MSFMKPYITDKMNWVNVDTPEGMIAVPESDYRAEDYPDGNPEFVTGYGAYLSAPGYLDQTDISVFETVSDAARHLLDMYYDMDEMSAEETEEADELERLASA